MAAIAGDHQHQAGSSSSTALSSSAALPPIPPSSSLPVAHEVLRLLGYVLDMWSRHKDSLQVLACGGDMKEEEVDVMMRLNCELRALLEDLAPESSSSSSSSGGEMEDEEASQVGVLVWQAGPGAVIFTIMSDRARVQYQSYWWTVWDRAPKI